MCICSGAGMLLSSGSPTTADIRGVCDLTFYRDINANLAVLTHSIPPIQARIYIMSLLTSPPPAGGRNL